MRPARFAALVLSGSIAVASCGQKSDEAAKPADIVAMLNSGDPRACVDKGVQDAALAISVPDYHRFVAEHARIPFTEVSASKVDKELKEIICEANLDVSAAIPSMSKTTIVYKIRPALDKEGQWIVVTQARQYTMIVQSYMAAMMQAKEAKSFDADANLLADDVDEDANLLTTYEVEEQNNYTRAADNLALAADNALDAAEDEIVDDADIMVNRY